MTVLDSTAILRYLLADDKEEAEKIDSLIKDGACTNDVALLKASGSLETVYKVPRKEIANMFVDLLSAVRIEDVVVHMETFRLFATTELSYEQCLLYAYKELGNIGDIYSSDKKTMDALTDDRLAILPKKN